MTTEFLILTRAVHFGACLLFFGVFAFERFVAATILSGGANEIRTYGKKQIQFFSLILLPIILLSGICWFALVAATMSGQSPEIGILKIVWAQTQFGTVWKIRLIFWLAAIIVAAIFPFSKSQTAFQNFLIWLQLFSSGALLGSLAWAGHGQENSRWHLCADVLHLLAAGFWPMGLLSLILLLKKFGKTSEIVSANLLAAVVRRFSNLSLAGVVLLAATGFVNSWFLVGSISNLFGQTYGRWLLAKISLFCIAVAIGAVNLLRLKPLVENSQNKEIALARLRSNVRMELILGATIILIVAVLGILPPANR
jgi:putative copper resistance protein D